MKPVETASGRSSERKPGRADFLVLTRESDESDLLLFDGMREQTYQALRSDPRVEAVRKLGLLPLKEKHFDVTITNPDGSARTVPVTSEVRTVGRTRVIVFWVENTVHAWSMASAAKVNNDARINDFNQVLMDLIREARPREIHVASFSRLLRDQMQAGLLLHACGGGNVDTIVSGQVTLDLNSPTGILMFTVLGMIAAQERDWIVQRMVAGRLAGYRRGEWIQGKSLVPFGYRYDTKSRRLVIDEDSKPVVRAMLEVLASHANARDKVAAMSRLGVPMPRAVDESGDRIPIRRAKNAASAVDALLSCASIWVRGEHLFRLAISGLNLKELAGVRVVKYDDDDNDLGEVQMMLEVPVPEGGWAPDDLLNRVWQVAAERAATLRARRGVKPRPLAPEIIARYPHRAGDESLYLREYMRPRVGAQAKSRVSPFTGRTWPRGNQTMEIAAVGKGRYQLRSVIKPDGARP